MDLSDALILVFTGVVAVSTAVYAGLTWWLARETRRMREVHTEPRISVRAEMSERGAAFGIDLVVRNEGLGPAQNIMFEFDGDPTYFHKDRPIDQFPIIRDGLPYLGSSQSFRMLLGYLFGEEYKKAAEAPWTFEVRYENQSGRLRRDTFVVDFSQFYGPVVGGTAPLHDIAKHLDALQRDVHHLTTGFSKLRVITQTKEQERAELEDLVRDRRQEIETAETSTDGDNDQSNGASR